MDDNFAAVRHLSSEPLDPCGRSVRLVNMSRQFYSEGCTKYNILDRFKENDFDLTDDDMDKVKKPLEIFKSEIATLRLDGFSFENIAEASRFGNSKKGPALLPKSSLVSKVPEWIRVRSLESWAQSDAKGYLAPYLPPKRNRKAPHADTNNVSGPATNRHVSGSEGTRVPTPEALSAAAYNMNTSVDAYEPFNGPPVQSGSYAGDTQYYQDARNSIIHSNMAVGQFMEQDTDFLSVLNTGPAEIDVHRQGTYSSQVSASQNRFDQNGQPDPFIFRSQDARQSSVPMSDLNTEFASWHGTDNGSFRNSSNDATPSPFTADGTTPLGLAEVARATDASEKMFYGRNEQRELRIIDGQVFQPGRSKAISSLNEEDRNSASRAQSRSSGPHAPTLAPRSVSAPVMYEIATEPRQIISEAERAERLKHKFKGAIDEKLRLHAEKQNLERALQISQAEKAKLESDVKRLEVKIDSLKRSRSERKEELKQAREDLSKAIGLSQQFGANMERLQQRLSVTEGQLSHANQEVSQLRNSVHRQSHDLEKAKAVLDELKRELSIRTIATSSSRADSPQAGNKRPRPSSSSSTFTHSSFRSNRTPSRPPSSTSLAELNFPHRASDGSNFRGGTEFSLPPSRRDSRATSRSSVPPTSPFSP